MRGGPRGGSAVQTVERIEARLGEAANPDRAEHEKRYLKSDLEHYGASVPAIRKVAKGALAEPPELDHDGLVELVEALWRRPVHECRMAAVELLDMRSSLLGPGDLPLVERLIREARTWALVDGLAAKVAGSVVERHPGESAPALDRWAADEDLWVRRAALLALLVPLRRGEGNFERFARYADPMLGDREFFIGKAIGWVLRETAKKRPDLVFGWLLPRAGRASGVTVREAVKPLTAEQKNALRAARDGARSG